MSPKADDTLTRRGFTLVEVLVALVVAGLFLGAFGRAFALAWGGARRPMESVAALTLARNAALARSSSEIAGPARALGYGVERSVLPVMIEVLPSPVAPAPLAASGTPGAGLQGLPAANDTMPGVTRGAPTPGSESGPMLLRAVRVRVKAPSGRTFAFETVRLLRGE